MGNLQFNRHLSIKEKREYIFFRDKVCNLTRGTTRAPDMRSYVLLIGIICCALSFSSFSQSVYGKDRDIIKQSARFIQEGKELFDRNDYYGAVEKWTEALKGDPWNSEAKLLIEKACSSSRS